MTVEARKSAFLRLRDKISTITYSPDAEFGSLMEQAYIRNNWFTEENIKAALGSIIYALKNESFDRWTSSYRISDSLPQNRVGVVMAGNIPLVGFHDFLCVLISGNKFIGKLSSDDQLLLPYLSNLLVEIEPQYAEQVEFVEKLEKIDAFIGTGSNNTARYFEYYFRKYPNIIRHNRNSLAVLTGNESNKDLTAFGDDIFNHFGLGCRSVSKIFVPKNYDFDLLFKAIYDHKDIINHNKYANNYDYHKAIYLMNQIPLLENGFLLLKEDSSLSSPIGTLFYEYYEADNYEQRIAMDKNNIQCVVSSNDVPFGKSQSPELWDYADDADTMKFLCEL